MRRFLSVALCAMLLMGVLPSISPPAEAIVAAGVTVNTYAAYIGDTFTWTIYGEVGAAGSYTVSVAVFRDGQYYSSAVTNQLYYNFRAISAGVYCAQFIVDDLTSDSICIYSPSAMVSLRAAPKITKIEALGGTSLKVTWTKMAGATGYILLRSTSKTGTYSKIKTTTATSFINTGLTPGKAYYYKVECYNLIGVTQYISSGYSAMKAGVPLAKPAAPTAKVLGGTSVKISWSAVTGATGYELWRAAGAAETYARVYRGTARSFTNTALKTGKL